MSCAGIFILILAIITIHRAQSECNPQMCNNVCTGIGLDGGVCNGNECDCKYGEKCSKLIELSCDYLCDKLELKGECDKNDSCICKAELEICLPFKCQEQCEEDPRAAECHSIGGVVTAIGCIKYGPIKTCGCLCTYLEANGRLVTDRENKFNYFVQAKEKNWYNELFRRHPSVINNVLH